MCDSNVTLPWGARKGGKGSENEAVAKVNEIIMPPSDELVIALPRSGRVGPVEEAHASGSSPSVSSRAASEVSLVRQSASREMEEHEDDPLEVHAGDGEGGSSEEDGEEKPYCRICFEEATKDNPLFRPCNCKGSVAYVHHACLLRWATESDRMECELCGGKFRVPRGMSQIVPQRAVLSRACALAQNSAALSSRIFAILPVHSGTLTESSTILYLNGYGHETGCTELGLCRFPTAYPSILDGVMSQDEWVGVIGTLNRTCMSMINISWRFVVFLASLMLNISLIILLSFLQHSTVVPFMSAVIIIQLLPALLFAWVAASHNLKVQGRVIAKCAELNERYGNSGIAFNFHVITTEARHVRGGRLLGSPLGEPKTIKFLIIERQEVLSTQV